MLQPFSFLLLGEVSHKSVALLLEPVLSPLAGSLGLGALGVHLLLEDTLTGLLGLGLVDLYQCEFPICGLGMEDRKTHVLDEAPLVLESVALARVVQLVVEVFVDLTGSTVLDEQATENTHAAHPEYLGRHTCVGGTLALTVTGVTTSTASLLEVTGSAARVHGIRLLDDDSV